jgi:hypothetical protein
MKMSPLQASAELNDIIGTLKDYTGFEDVVTPLELALARLLRSELQFLNASRKKPGTRTAKIADVYIVDGEQDPQ